MKGLLETTNLLDLDYTIAFELFNDIKKPWEALPKIAAFIPELGAKLPDDEYERVSEFAWIARDAKVAPTASLNGAFIIDHEAEIRHCAFIRGNAIVGKNAVVGNSTELKNSVLFDNAQVPHYNYVGDSILGYKSHMGAGAITSNVKSDKTPVTILTDDRRIETKLRKFGAIIGDFVEIGCNSVLNPGSVIGRNTTVYPLSRVRGYVREGSIFKSGDRIVNKQ